RRAREWVERRRLRDVGMDEEAGAARGDAPADAAPEDRRLQARLVAALGELTAEHREVVLLHDLEDWTHQEIAQALGIAEVTSRQRLFQARRVLRKRLEDDAPGAAEGDHER